jgi:hypothetical protein
MTAYCFNPSPLLINFTFMPGALPLFCTESAGDRNVTFASCALPRWPSQYCLTTMVSNTLVNRAKKLIPITFPYLYVSSTC